MKKVILVAVILTMAVFVHAQQIPAKSVPDAVLKAINNPFPELEHMPNAPVKWFKDGYIYKASLYEGSANPAKIEIDSLGHVMRVERKVSVSTMPANAVEYLKAQYKDTDMEISEVYMITAKGKNTYRAKLTVKPVYMFDSKGQLLPGSNEPKAQPKSK